jgi:hypothetical protein
MLRRVYCGASAALLSLAVLLGTLPLREAAAQTGQRCFPETGFCIEGRIREFWEQNGGLPVFGYPIGPQQQEVIEGVALQVQWFERNRLELHPENARPYDVLLGRLGVDRLNQQARNWYTFPKSPAQPGCRYFPETEQNVCGRILDTWRANGLEFDGQAGKSEAENLALWGLPLSPAQPETLSDGRQYVVQWFERGRFELHPENAPPYDVLLGLLGSEVRNNGGAPAQPGQPTPTPTPAPAPPAPEQINFEEPGRLTCDDLAIDEIFQPGQTYTTNIGEFDIPVEVPICLRAWTPNVQVQIEVRKPDGSRDREEVTPDANGFADWYYQRLTGNRQGDYEVTVRQGETRVDGEFELERTPESEPKVLVRERVVEPGDEVEVHVLCCVASRGHGEQRWAGRSRATHGHRHPRRPVCHRLLPRPE